METQPDAILVATEGQCAFVRVVGRGSFKSSPALKKFGQAEIEKGCKRIVLDMQECLGMDSTFMGVLAGLALVLKRRTAGVMNVIRIGSKNLALFETLGLTHLVQMVDLQQLPSSHLEKVMPQAAPLKTEGTDKQTTTETMIDAHETLVAISPDNLPKFKDVLAYLREDLKQSVDKAEPK